MHLAAFSLASSCGVLIKEFCERTSAHTVHSQYACTPLVNELLHAKRPCTATSIWPPRTVRSPPDRAQHIALHKHEHMENIKHISCTRFLLCLLMFHIVSWHFMLPYVALYVLMSAFCRALLTNSVRSRVESRLYSQYARDHGAWRWVEWVASTQHATSMWYRFGNWEYVRTHRHEVSVKLTSEPPTQMCKIYRAKFARKVHIDHFMKKIHTTSIVLPPRFSTVTSRTRLRCLHVHRV